MISHDIAGGVILMLSTHGYVAAEPELGLPDTGGQVVFVLELAKQLVEMGCRVDVVTRRFEDQPEFDDMGPGLRVWRIPFGGEGFVRKEDMHDHLDEFERNFLTRVREDGIEYDLVNSHYWDAGWAAQHLAEELDIPHVHTPHSLGARKREDMVGDPQKLEGNYRFEERISKESLVYRRCDRVIATTNQQVRHLGEHYEIPESQITMIPPGIDECRYTPVDSEMVGSIRRHLGFGDNDVYTVGRAAASKGYDLLIKALPELRQSVPDARLQLALGANSTKDLRMVKEWMGIAESVGIAAQVKWLGYIPDEAMADHYRAASVFALPSRYEPFGMTAVEAMACGTPCVVTVHGGLQEMVKFGSNALVADPKRPVEFATMLSMPLRYPRLRERLSIEGARFAHDNFAWRTIAQRTAEVFQRCRGRHEAPPPWP